MQVILQMTSHNTSMDQIFNILQTKCMSDIHYTQMEIWIQFADTDHQFHLPNMSDSFTNQPNQLHYVTSSAATPYVILTCYRS